MSRRTKLWNLLTFIMQNMTQRDASFKPVFDILMMMCDAGDGDIGISCGRFGLVVTKDTIEIVDIEDGSSLGTLKLELNLLDTRIEDEAADEPDPCDRCNRPMCHGCEHCK